ncbi:hypothetical protein HJG60_008487 [Phyllostomus discolor]|uniref:Uncharacterized protein n=1 Tax=Phyllostomus discolor TaxID=89673 RepID=A0A833Z1M5_9CHIR|nr:hypothetical protein HJG60_008487 [Phyllostomus discolor]
MGLVDRPSEYIPEQNKSALGNRPKNGPKTPVRRTGDSVHMDGFSVPGHFNNKQRIRKAVGFLRGISKLWTLRQPAEHQPGKRGAGDPGEGAASCLIDSPKSDLVKETRSQWEAAIHQFGLEAPGGEVEEKPPN